MKCQWVADEDANETCTRSSEAPVKCWWNANRMPMGCWWVTGKTDEMFHWQKLFSFWQLCKNWLTASALMENFAFFASNNWRPCWLHKSKLEGTEKRWLKCGWHEQKQNQNKLNWTVMTVWKARLDWGKQFFGHVKWTFLECTKHFIVENDLFDNFHKQEVFSSLCVWWENSQMKQQSQHKQSKMRTQERMEVQQTKRSSWNESHFEMQEQRKTKFWPCWHQCSFKLICVLLQLWFRSESTTSPKNFQLLLHLRHHFWATQAWSAWFYVRLVCEMVGQSTNWKASVLELWAVGVTAEKWPKNDSPKAHTHCTLMPT